MDIQKWLNDTVEAKAPPIPTQTPDSNFFRRTEKPNLVFKHKHAPKRRKSDSSLLDPLPHSHKAPPKESKAPTEGNLAVSTYSDVSHSNRSDSTGRESLGYCYARKPRRQTRPERYNPQLVKERGKHVHHSRRSESKRTRRKSKRSKGDKPGSGVAQSFHANNVSQDRLTLKPREQLGIFNKGKTSTAIRGRGLPDLVFSEMKFLQKENDPPENAPRQGVPQKKKRTKNHVHTKEGEISVFFTSVRPALAEKDSNAQTQAVRDDDNTTAAASHREREQSTKSGCVVPTVEVPDRGSFLGLASRGPRHESTSYVSWSESGQGLVVTPQQTEQALALGRAQYETSKHQAASTTIGRGNGVIKCPAPGPNIHRAHDSAEHSVVSSVVRSDSQQRALRSHLYPQHISSPRKANLVSCAKNLYSTDPADLSSSMPRVVSTHASSEFRRRELSAGSRPTRPKQPSPVQTRDTSSRQQSVAENEKSETEVRLQTSSDLGKVIQQCNYTFHERRATAPRRRHTVQSEMAIKSDRREGNVDRLRHVRFSGLDIPAPVMPNFFGPSMYAQQVHHQTISPQESHREANLLGDFNMVGQEHTDDLYDMPYGEPNWDEYSEEPELYDLDIGPEDHGMGGSLVSGEMAQRQASENSIVAPGFWRPNRLY